MRESEIKSLIDEVTSDNFLQTTLGFKEEVKLDLAKLTIAGQSMGGATVLRVGDSDRRVKCILTHDPWITPIHKEIHSGTLNNFTSDQSLFLLNTYLFLSGLPEEVKA